MTLPEAATPYPIRDVPAMDAIRFVADIIHLNEKSDFVIAGGACRKAYSGDMLGNSDVDIFVFSHIGRVATIKNIYDELRKHTNPASPRQEINDKTGFVQVILEKDGVYITAQLITKWAFAGAYDLMMDFDITVSQFYYDGVSVKGSKDAIRDEETKTLNIKGTKRNIVARVAKYLRYGYRISHDQLPYLLSKKHITDIAKDGRVPYDPYE